MKNKFLVVALIGVILGLGMVLFGCDLFGGCPCGAKEVAIGRCTSHYKKDYYDQCSNKCITTQGTYAGYGDNYYFDSKKSCTCK